MCSSDLARVPGARLELLAKLGHLAHEEAPKLAAELIVHAMAATERGDA